MGINDRLRRLENVFGGGEGCPECGEGSGAPIKFSVIHPNPRGEDEPFEPKYCSTCGAQTSFTLYLGEHEPHAEEGEEE